MVEADLTRVLFDAGVAADPRPPSALDPEEQGWRYVTNGPSTATAPAAQYYPTKPDGATGYNGWTVVDDTATHGGGYLHPVTPTNADTSHTGWRLHYRLRLVSVLTGNDQTVYSYYYHRNKARGGWGVGFYLARDGANNAVVSCNRGALVFADGNGANYFDLVLSSDVPMGEAVPQFNVTVDGQLLGECDGFAAASDYLHAWDWVDLGSGSSSGIGTANWNVVSFTLVDAASPPVAPSPHFAVEIEEENGGVRIGGDTWMARRQQGDGMEVSHPIHVQGVNIVDMLDRIVLKLSELDDRLRSAGF